MTVRDYVMERLKDNPFILDGDALRSRMMRQSYDWKLNCLNPHTGRWEQSLFTGTLEEAREHLLTYVQPNAQGRPSKTTNWGEFFDLIGAYQIPNEVPWVLETWVECAYATLAGCPDVERWMSLRHDFQEAYHRETLRYDRTAWLRWIKRILQRKGK